MSGTAVVREGRVSGRRILFFDTSLGEGGFSAGASLSLNEKLELAAQLARLGVAGIVAGFPMSSPGDFAAARAIAEASRTWEHSPIIAALARPIAADVDTCWRAISASRRPRITVLCAAPAPELPEDAGPDRDRDRDRERDPNHGGEAIAKQVAQAITRARGYCQDVQLSIQDAFRTDGRLLELIIQAGLEAGAGTVTLIDSTGYALPAEVRGLVSSLVTTHGPRAAVGIHTHDDLGLATANALAAIEAGADQVEGTITGLGARAGNAALEELVMLLHARPLVYALDTGIDRSAIYRTAKLVSVLAGHSLPAHKAVVGDGVLPQVMPGTPGRGSNGLPVDPALMDSRSIGRPPADDILETELDRDALAERLAVLDIRLTPEQLADVHEGYLELAGRKQAVTVADLEAIAGGVLIGGHTTFTVRSFSISTGSAVQPTATVHLATAAGPNLEATATGDGPVDAMYHAVDRITEIPVTLLDYALTAATSGKDALGQVAVKLEYKGHVFSGRGVSTDVLAASLRAYVHALNKIAATRNRVGDFGAAKL